jgi:predicted nucleic acid-binding protein
MKILYDRSTLLALYTEKHPHHKKVKEKHLQFIQEGGDFYISAHSIAELYSNLTRERYYFKLSSEKAHVIIIQITDELAQSVSLTESDYVDVIDKLKEEDLRGPVIYDGLISWTARKIKADLLVTLNEKDFKKLDYIHDAELVNPLTPTQTRK